jgi:hypothetical protein
LSPDNSIRVASTGLERPPCLPAPVPRLGLAVEASRPAAVAAGRPAATQGTGYRVSAVMSLDPADRRSRIR